jgi:hypothetical protein
MAGLEQERRVEQEHLEQRVDAHLHLTDHGRQSAQWHRVKCNGRGEREHFKRPLENAVLDAACIAYKSTMGQLSRVTACQTEVDRGCILRLGCFYTRQFIASRMEV